MQRVAEELLSELELRPDLSLYPVVLRGSWRWIHIRTGPFLFRSVLRLRRLIRSEQIDTVLFSSMVTAALAIVLQRLFRSKGIVSLAIVHGLDITTPSRTYQKIVARVFRSVDMVLPVSGATADACLDRGLPSNRVQVVHNGVDTRRFEPLQDRDTTRAHLMKESPAALKATPDDAFILCSVGRLVKRKGFAWFVETVMPRLPENVHYWIAGDGLELRSIHDAIERENLAHRVRLLGKVTERHLHALYRGADLFLMPNIHVPGDMEGFGIVMLEAGMSGLPTVGSRIEGIKEVINDGENGVFVESEDVDGFVQAILRYAQDRSLLESARDRARSYTEASFGWPSVADRYLTICANIRSKLYDSSI